MASHRPRLRRLLALALFTLIALGDTAAPRAQEGLRIVPLVRDDKVLVTFELADGFTADVREAIGSGLKTTFTYTIELRMEVPAWVDRTIDSAVVSTSDKFDNLTRRHSLVRTLDGRVEETVVTEDEATVRRFLTAMDRLPLFRTSKLEANREYYVRVSVRARPQGGSILGWANAISGLAKFTYIP